MHTECVFNVQSTAGGFIINGSLEGPSLQPRRILQFLRALQEFVWFERKMRARTFVTVARDSLIKI